MITLRRNTERRHDQRGRQDTWLSFDPREPPPPPPPPPAADPYGALMAFDEIRLAPGASRAPCPPGAAETVTYVYLGALAQGRNGGSGVLQAGEFQHMITGREACAETNTSRTNPAHVFRIALVPSQVGLDGVRVQMRFAAAQRRNLLCVIASPDGRGGSLRTLQDVIICSSVVDPGHHLIHPLLPGRSAWLHVVRGGVALHDVILTQGDGVGVTGEPSISFTAQEHSEILLVDLGPR